MNPRISQRSTASLLAIAALALGAVSPAYAISDTWDGSQDTGAWADAANWSTTPASVPTTGETATFDNAGGAVDTIDLGAGVTIGSILFDSSSVAAYTIGSGTAGSQTLTLDNSGSIAAASTINANQIFNAQLVLGADATAGSYGITNNDAENSLTFAGAISGGSTGTAGAKTLNISTAPLSAGGINLSGAITNGGASSLALAFTPVSGNVQMNIGNAGNTYSGGTSIAGNVRLNVNGGAGAGLGAGDVTVASGGQVYLNPAGAYANNFEISSTGYGSETQQLGGIRMGNGPVTINGNVTLAANSAIGVDSGRVGFINGNITGAFNLDKRSTAAGTGSPLTLTGTNDYGTTTITRGVISFAKQSAMYNSTTSKWTKDYLDVESGAGLALGVGDSASGYWDAAGVAAFLDATHMGASTTTDGFKSGSLIGFDTTNATAGTFTYGAIGNIGTSSANGVVKLGTGTLVLNATNTYTGPTNVDAGTLNLASGGSISGTAVTVGGGTFSLNGTLTGTTLSVNTGTFSNAGGTATFSGAANFGNGGANYSQTSGTSNFASIDTSNTADFGFINITGGNFTVTNFLTLRRSSAGAAPSLAAPTAASTTTGLYVNGASSVVQLGTLNIGTANSSASARVNAGSLTVTGVVTVGKTTSTTRWDILQVSGGAFTAADTTTGVVLAPNNGTNINNAEFYVSGGVATVGRIAFGASTDTKGGNGFLILGKTTETPILYVGSGGIVKASTTSGADLYNYTIGLNSGTLAASADWSSALNMTLGTNPTIKAADAADVARNITLSGNISGGGLTKTGAGTLELSGINTYTGTTTARAGTLTLSGARTGSSGAITVADTAGTNATLNIQNGTIALAASRDFIVGNAPTTAATATVTQSGGAVSFTSGNGLLLANGGVAGSISTYNLSGGSITTFASTTRGIMLGTNTGKGSSTFNLSGTGVLNMTSASGGGGDAILQIGRSDAAASNTTNLFAQTGGTANVGILAMGGKTGGATGVSSTLTLTGGTFSANQFTVMGAGNTNTIAINIGGTADVTLPAFPATALGAGSTATLSFDGGTLRPGAASADYFGSISSAVIEDGGATFDVAVAKDISINENLLTHGSSTGGGLTKSGLGTLTLTGANTYSGATVVNVGTLALVGGSQASPVTVGSGAFLGFTLGSGTTSTAAVTLNAGAKVKITGTPTLPSYTLITATAITGTPVLDTPISGYTLMVDGGTTLKLVAAASSGFASWISNPLFALAAGDQDATDDPDNDGMANVLEYVLNGNPSASDPSILPTLAVAATDFEFTYSRLDDSMADTTQTFEYGDDLTGWTPILVPAASGTVGAASFTITGNGTAPDTIQISIPKDSNTSMFGRLKVTQP